MLRALSMSRCAAKTPPAACAPAAPRTMPISFSAPMVSRLLGGHKTQTRRLSSRWDKLRPGDLLWVREAFAVSQALDGERLRAPERAHEGWPCWYAAGGELWPGAKTGGPAFVTRGRWRSPLHMPRFASRIRLRARSVRAEPLSAISEEDARAEGIERSQLVGMERLFSGGCLTAREAFAALWNKLHGASRSLVVRRFSGN